MAISLTPADSHLYCTGSKLPNTANPFSINVWLNATWSSGNVYSFVGLYDGIPSGGSVTTNAGLQIGTRALGQVTCWTYGGTARVFSPGTTMSSYDGQWVMITYVYPWSNGHYLYVNGSLVASNNSTIVTSQMTQVYINGFPPTSSISETSNFSVNLYSTYNRALSASEILSLYNNEGHRGGPDPDLSCRYDFSERGAGQSVLNVIDLTGNGQNLSHTGLANTATYSYGNNAVDSNLRTVL